LDTHGTVDVLVNNAGKSIRRSVNRAYDRFHDYQRTMQVNYFAPVKLILDLLPVMRERRSGHIINISTIGLQMNTPRFSPYAATPQHGMNGDSPPPPGGELPFIAPSRRRPAGGGRRPAGGGRRPAGARAGAGEPGRGDRAGNERSLLAQASAISLLGSPQRPA